MLAAVRAILAATALLATASLPAATAAPAVTARSARTAKPALTVPLGITVPAPPTQLAKVRPAELPVLQQIGVPRAWNAYQARGKGVLVAVLDTGVDPTTPDLTSQVTVGPDFVAGVDPKGYRPPLLHGSYVASLIAGHGQGPLDGKGVHQLGVLGVAPAAHILSVRVIPDEGEPGYADYNRDPKYANAIGDGIRYAVNHGAAVINLSLGSQQATAYERQQIAYAISKNVLVVASAGNDGTTSGFAPYAYPASFPGVISVAAVNSAGARAPFSAQNSSVVISAPGVDVIGAGPHGEYINAVGTSPAAAFVSGVAALILSKYPGMPVPVVEQALITTTTHRPPGGYRVDVGFGEVNAAAALAAVGADFSQDADGPDNADSGASDSNLSDSGSMTAASSIPGLSKLASPTSSLARSPVPIVVTHRSRDLVMVWGVVSTVAAVVSAIALAALVVFTRRPRPRSAGLELANMPPGDDLIGLPSPRHGISGTASRDAAGQSARPATAAGAIASGPSCSPRSSPSPSSRRGRRSWAAARAT
jgi:subtilisin family serine protease